MQSPYSLEIEKQMQEKFRRLSEKDKRLYAGVEALKFPSGGISYIAHLFVCSRNTILRGIIELGGRRGQKLFPEKPVEVKNKFRLGT